jgi:hypothetical protein
MAKVLIQILVIVILASLLELFAPWWSIAIAAFAGGYFFRTSANFFAGFFAIAMLWLVTSWIIDLSASAPLADRVAAIFSLSKPLLFLVTSLLGGLVGGFAAMTGSALRKPRRTNRYY